MVFGGFGGENVMEVQIQGDGSGLSNTLGELDKGLLNFRTAVAGAGLALAGLAAGGMAAAINAAREFEQQMIELEKVTDPATAREMGDAIRDMAAEMPVAHRELANIASAAGRLGIEGTENIEEFTRVTAEMATATDLSANEAANAFARLTQLMDIPIEDVRRLGDVINELSNTAATSSSEITDALLRSGAALTQLGLSADEIAALSASLNEVSESSERAGTRLRRMAQVIQTAGEDDVEKFASALGITTEEFERLREDAPLDLIRMMAEQMAAGGEEARALGQTLDVTTQQALAALGQNLESLDRNLETANQQMDEGGSLAEEFAAANSTFNAQLQRTQNQLRNVAIEIGEQLLPYASQLLSEVADGIEAFARWNEETDGLAGTLLLVGGLIAGIAAALVTLVGGPVAAAIGVVAALATAWQTNWAGIRDTVTSVAADIKNIYSEVFGTVLGEEIQTASKWLDELQVNWGALWDFITERVGIGLAVIGAGIGQIIDFIATTIGTVINFIKTAMQAQAALREGDFGAAREAVESGFGRQQELFSEFGERAQERAAGLTERVQAAREEGLTSFGEVMSMGGVNNEFINRQTAPSAVDGAQSAQQDSRVVVELKNEMLDAQIEEGAGAVVQRARDQARYTTGGPTP